MAGTLYIVPTPVGNLQDMTPRALEVLQKADLILAEDTRTSAVLMRHFDINTPMQSHHKYNEHARVEELAQKILSGMTVALVSDAGTPGISDPGFLLSRQCRRLDIPVITLPGATAFVPALVSSGLPCDRFTFEGFLPPKKGRQSRLEELSRQSRTFIIYESPLRTVKTLEQLAQVCGGDRPASVSREISKLHEQTIRGTLSELVEHFKENPPKGEIVIVVQGKIKDEDYTSDDAEDADVYGVEGDAADTADTQDATEDGMKGENRGVDDEEEINSNSIPNTQAAENATRADKNPEGKVEKANKPTKLSKAEKAAKAQEEAAEAARNFLFGAPSSRPNNPKKSKKHR